MTNKPKLLQESVHEYLARGGEVKRVPTPEHKPSRTSRYKFKDVNKAPGEVLVRRR